MLTLQRVSISFGGVHALTNLSLNVQPGALHGLIGPNGAGKTTAMNVICGLYPANAGTMLLDGAPYLPRPDQLASLGVARTFQGTALVSSLNVLDNTLLGSYSRTTSNVIGCALRLPGARREEQAVRARAREALDEVGFIGSATAVLAELSAWQRRQVELARALMIRPRLLLLDEPAAGLTGTEVTQLADLLGRMRKRGKLSILLVEHNVPLVFKLCDTVTAMADGKDVTHGTPAAVRKHPDVIRAYLGTGVGALALSPAAVRARDQASATAPQPVVLQLKDVCSGYSSNTVLHNIGIEVRAGETVAIFGPNGAGKSTLFNTIIGERSVRSGSVIWRGERIERQSIQSIIRRGIGIVPQGRVVLERQSVEDNLLISTSGLGLSSREFQQRLDEIYEQFPSLAERRKLKGASLSGGERQMLAIAKVLIRRPSLVMLDEPSIGLAPTVVQELQRIVTRLTASGMAVIIGEQSVDWVVPLATRAYAISAGRIVREGPAEALADSSSLADQYLGAHIDTNNRSDIGAHILEAT